MPGLPGIFFFENKRLFFFGRCFAGLSDHCYIRLQRVSCSKRSRELPKLHGESPVDISSVGKNIQGDERAEYLEIRCGL